MTDAERIKQMEAENAELRAALAAAMERIARLEKNSGNSSKPPSSDIVKPKKKYKDRKPRKRKAGGQKGRKACVRAPFPADRVDEVFEHGWTGLDPARFVPLEGAFATTQQVELAERPFVVTEHRFQKYLDQKTGRVVTAPRPGDVRLGLFGPRMLAFTTCLKAELHGSYSAIQSLLTDAMGLTVSTGFLAKAMSRVSAALDGTYEQLTQTLREQDAVHVDETGHYEAGSRWWTWVGTCPQVAVFRIQTGRGSAQLAELLGDDFAGTVCSDSFSAYLKFAREHPGVSSQFCWAHLIRDLRFAAEKGDRFSRRWADKVLGDVKKLFRSWHRGQIAACRRARDAVLQRCRHPGKGTDARRLGVRVWKQRAGYSRFLDRPDLGLEPTNNPAERELRKLVLHRSATQGTRGEAGRRWWERVFSVRATCRKQGRSVFGYLVEAIGAAAAGGATPRLV